MIINVKMIKETSYIIEVPGLASEEDGKLFNDLICEPCMDDVMDVEFFLEEKGVYFEMMQGENDSRIEIKLS